jgi:aldose sugar dehydrogenase
MRRGTGAPAALSAVATMVLVGLGAMTGCNAAEPVADNRPGPPADPGATHDYGVTEVVTGLEHPWAVAFLPGGDLLITERPGRIRLVRDGQLRPEPVAGAPDARAGGQGGMLDLALHPDFATNRLVYISYSKAVEGGRTTAVARARWDNDRLEGLADVFVADAVGGGRHFGSRLAFDHDGFLFITVGDRGEQDRAQDLTDHAGTTIRLHDDGRVPADNPFVDRDDALPEIYTYGNRNAQGMAVHPETGEVWQNEHGPGAGDEINLMRAGGNYGWPVVRFGADYDGTPFPDPRPDDGFIEPLVDWTDPDFPPSGMAFYTGDRFPNWKGHTFHGGLAPRHLRRVVFDGTRPVHQEELLTDYGERIRAVYDGPDGYLYLLTDSATGALVRLEPAEAGG